MLSIRVSVNAMESAARRAARLPTCVTPVATATTRQQELLAVLDITKNQASATVDEEAEQPAGLIQEVPQQNVRPLNRAATTVAV